MVRLDYCGKNIEVIGLPEKGLSYLRERRSYRQLEVRPTQIDSVFNFEADTSHYRLVHDEVLVAERQPIELLIELMLARLDLRVATVFPEYTFVRARVATDSSGRVLVIAGGSFSGKAFLMSLLPPSKFVSTRTNFVALTDSGTIVDLCNRSEERAVAAVLNVMYDPRVPSAVQNVTPGQAVFGLLPLVIGDETSFAHALPRLASMCERALFCCEGTRGPVRDFDDLLTSVPRLDELR